MAGAQRSGPGMCALDQAGGILAGFLVVSFM